MLAAHAQTQRGRLTTLRKVAVVVRSLSLLGTVALLSIASLGASELPASANDAVPSGTESKIELGPRGEIPVDGVTATDIETVAKSHDMSFEDARFILFEGSAAILEFTEKHRDDSEFGGVNVIQDGGLRIQIRTTQADSTLADTFESALRRPVERFVGGRSSADLEKDMSAATAALSERGVDFPFTVTKDFERGTIVVSTPAKFLAQARAASLPPSVEVRSDEAIGDEVAASFAGTEMNPGCTVGFAVQNSSGTHGLITAGHCTDTGTSAYGFTTGNAQSEVCTDVDRQLHTTPATQIWEGFYNGNVWTNIHAVAGGWYPGQNYFRRGRNTIATGTIQDISTGTASSPPGDCPTSYTVRGFVLNLSTGSGVVGGDSGGPLMLAYNGQWYVAGITSTAGPAGSAGRSAWRSIPAGWTACTAQFDC